MTEASQTGTGKKLDDSRQRKRGGKKTSLSTTRTEENAVTGENS